MLVISVKVGESIIFDEKTEMTVCKTKKGRMVLSFDAPKEIIIKRKKIENVLIRNQLNDEE